MVSNVPLQSLPPTFWTSIHWYSCKSYGRSYARLASHQNWESLENSILQILGVPFKEHCLCCFSPRSTLPTYVWFSSQWLLSPGREAMRGGRSWQSSSCQKRPWLKVELFLIYMFPKWVYLELCKAQPCPTYLPLCYAGGIVIISWNSIKAHHIRDLLLYLQPQPIFINTCDHYTQFPAFLKEIHSELEKTILSWYKVSILWSNFGQYSIWLSLSSSILYKFVLIIPSS